MFKKVIPVAVLFFLNISLGALLVSAEPINENLDRAKIEMEKALTQLDSTLNSDQLAKLNAAQKAWEKYKTLTTGFFTTLPEKWRGPSADSETLACTMLWQRIAHLNRMNDFPELDGNESDFESSDRELNKRYWHYREEFCWRFAGDDDDCKALDMILDVIKAAEIAWIAYRDKAAASEASLSPERAIQISWRVKTELTWERIGFFRDHWKSTGTAKGCLSSAPDLELEVFFEQLQTNEECIKERMANRLLGLKPIQFAKLLALFKDNNYACKKNLSSVFRKAAPELGPQWLHLIENYPNEFFLHTGNDKDVIDSSLLSALRAADPSIIPELIPFLRKDDIKKKRIAVNSLQRFGEKSAPAVPELIEILDYAEGNLKKETITALGAIGLAAKDALPKLIKLFLKEYNFDAAYAAVKIDPKNPMLADEVLKRYAKGEYTDSERRLLERAFIILGPRAKDALPQLMESFLKEDNFNAAYTAAKIDPKNPMLADEVIKRYAKGEYTDSERELLERALIILGPLAKDALPQLMESFLKEDNFDALYTAIKIDPKNPVAADEVIKRYAKGGHTDSERELLERALIILGPLAKDALPQLVASLLKEGDFDAAYTAIKIDPKNSMVADEVVKRYIKGGYTSSEEILLEKIIRSLGPLAKDVIPFFFEHLDSSKYELRYVVSEGDSEWVPRLIEALDDDYPSPFMDALVKIGEPSIKPLLALLENEQNPRIVRSAIRTLSQIEASAKEGIPVLLEFAEDDDQYTAAVAISALPSYGEKAKAAIPQLFDLYNGEDPVKRTAAMKTLHAIAPDSPRVKEIYLEPPYVLDPLADYYLHSVEQEEVLEKGPYAFSTDFNNDRLEDTAIKDEMSCGSGGCSYSVYLKVDDNKYKYVGNVAFMMDQYYKNKNTTGIGYMSAYWHMSRYYGERTFYEISMDGIVTLDKVNVYSWEMDRPFDKDRKKFLPEDCVPMHDN